MARWEYSISCNEEAIWPKEQNSKAREYRHDEKRKNNPPIGMVNYVLVLFALHYALCSMPYALSVCPLRHACRSPGAR